MIFIPIDSVILSLLQRVYIKCIVLVTFVGWETKEFLFIVYKLINVNFQTWSYIIFSV